MLIPLFLKNIFSEERTNLNNLLIALKRVHLNKRTPVYETLEHLNEDRNIERNVEGAQLDTKFLRIIDNFNSNTQNGDSSTLYDEFYDFKRGLCLIVNEEKFDFNAQRKV